MKKIVCVILCFSDCVLGMVQRVYLYDKSNSSAIDFYCSEALGEARIGTPVVFCDSVVGIWNGKCFDISKGSDDTEIEIISMNIPLTLNSLRAKTCHVCVPDLQVCGLTRIDNLVAEVLDNKHGIDIHGTLSAKFCEMHGSATINGKMDILEGGELRTKGIRNGYNLVNRGVLSSRGKLTIDTTRNYLSCVINEGIIHSDSGEIVLFASTFINGTNGKIAGNDVVF